MGDCGSLLIYNGVTVKTTYVEYENDGVRYPAYCLNKDKIGPDDGEYDVWIDGEISSLNIWRRLINGYPYKTLEELGVETKEEAFTATKQALYCYMHGNSPYSYEAIGEAGERTLNALIQIVTAAQNSTETKISSTVTINTDNTWSIDSVDSNYLSKTYSVSAESELTDCEIKLSINGDYDIGDILLTDLDNNPKTVFSPNEEFKILVPFKNTINQQEIKIEVNSTIESKLLFWGETYDDTLQDHALTYDSYSEATGETVDSIPKNSSKITIIKQDKETEERLAGVEFQLLDENNEVVYSGLKTNEEGIIEINNVVPGLYYLEETNTIEGYSKYEGKIEIDIDLYEEFTITVNNNKEKVKDEEPEVTITQKEVTSEIVEEVKVLPVAGY